MKIAVMGSGGVGGFYGGRLAKAGYDVHFAPFRYRPESKAMILYTTPRP